MSELIERLKGIKEFVKALQQDDYVASLDEAVAALSLKDKEVVAEPEKTPAQHAIETFKRIAASWQPMETASKEFDVQSIFLTRSGEQRVDKYIKGQQYHDYWLRDPASRPRYLENQHDPYVAWQPLLATPPPQGDGTDYYLQNGFLGDTMYFWRKEGKGYTPNLDDAEVFTKERAYHQHSMREEDVPWPVDYIRSKSRPSVNVQHVDRRDLPSPIPVEAARERQVICERCQGAGEREELHNVGDNHYSESVQCDACNGTGVKTDNDGIQSDDACPDCHGNAGGEK